MVSQRCCYSIGNENVLINFRMLSSHSLMNVAARYFRFTCSLILYYFLILFVCLYMYSFFYMPRFMLIAAQVILFTVIHRIVYHILIYVPYIQILWLFTLSSLNYLKSEWVTVFSSAISRINIYCLMDFSPVYIYDVACILLELMPLLRKPTLNKVYFTLYQA